MSSRSLKPLIDRPMALVCLRCQTDWPVAEYARGCPKCAREGHASNLKLEYSTKQRGIVLPYDHPVSLGEGFTPQFEMPELAERFKVGQLIVKLEYRNPVGSHKDRMSSFIVTRAKKCGAKLIVGASSGNGGLSIAAYAKLAAMEAEIAATDDLPAVYCKGIAESGAKLVTFKSSMERWHHLQKRVKEGAFAATNYVIPAIGTNPFGIEGYKPIASELASEFEPDIVITPCSRGDLISGICLGFSEIGDKLPRLIAVEPFPRLAKVLKGEDYRSTFSGVTAQRSIDGQTVTWQTLRAIHESSGDAVVVSDHEAFIAQEQLTAHQLSVELSAASALAALEKLSEGGGLKEQSIAIVLTGSTRTNPKSLKEDSNWKLLEEADSKPSYVCKA